MLSTIHRLGFLALGFALLAVAPGCNFVSSGGPGPADGSVEDGAYHNAYFGFSIAIPHDWFVAPEETRRYLQEVGSRALAGGDVALRAELEASAPRNHTLLAVFEHPVGKLVPFNRNFVVTAENLAHLPGIESGRDYLALLTNTLSRGALAYELRGEPRSLRLDGREFQTRDVWLPLGSGVLQTYLVRVEGDYGLSVVLSAPDEDGLAELLDAASRLRWD